MLSSAPNTILNSVRLSLNALCASPASFVGRKPHSRHRIFRLDKCRFGVSNEPYLTLPSNSSSNLAFYRRLRIDRSFNKFQNKDSISLVFRAFD